MDKNYQDNLFAMRVLKKNTKNIDKIILITFLFKNIK